jgi:hypothetical protein
MIFSGLQSLPLTTPQGMGERRCLVCFVGQAPAPTQVTAVHKANIMKLGDGLFLQCCVDVAKLYPNIKFDQMIVDNTTMQLVSNPQQFDVMVKMKTGYRNNPLKPR